MVRNMQYYAENRIIDAMLEIVDGVGADDFFWNSNKNSPMDDLEREAKDFFMSYSGCMKDSRDEDQKFDDDITDLLEEMWAGVISSINMKPVVNYILENMSDEEDEFEDDEEDDEEDDDDNEDEEDEDDSEEED